MSAPIKVILIDDHFLIHEAIAHQLANQPDLVLVATGTSGEELERLVEQHHPEVVLVDLSIPPQAGTSVRTAGRYPVLAAIRQLRAKYPSTQFVIISASADVSLIEGALDVDAKGYLLKDDALSTHLPDAIRAVNRGGLYFSKEVALQITAVRRPEPAAELTERQVEVLRAIVADANCSYAEQARRLGMAEDTFRNHLRAIFKKLGASNLTFAILRAAQLGLIPIYLISPQTFNDQTE